MSRYIDAKELRKAYRDWFDTYDWHHNGKDYEKTTISRAVRILDEQPTADVVEVKHGHWIINDNGTYSCSVCQSWIPNEQHYYANYCLHCGADMRGDEDDKG